MKKGAVIVLAVILSAAYLLWTTRPAFRATLSTLYDEVMGSTTRPPPDPAAVALGLNQADLPAGFTLEFADAYRVTVDSSLIPYVYPAFRQCWKRGSTSILTVTSLLPSRMEAVSALLNTRGPGSKKRADHLLGDVTLGVYPRTTMATYDRAVVDMSVSSDPVNDAADSMLMDTLIQRREARLQAAGMRLAGPFVLTGEVLSAHVDPSRGENVVIRLSAADASGQPFQYLPVTFSIYVSRSGNVPAALALPGVPGLVYSTILDAQTATYEFNWSGLTRTGGKVPNGHYAIWIKAVDTLQRNPDVSRDVNGHKDQEGNYNYLKFDVEVNDGRGT